MCEQCLPKEISLAKRKTIRFSAGTPGSPYSGMWRMVIKGDDVYLGFSRETMGNIKVSLHQSGVWTLSATQQSGWTFPDGNRRAKRWTRPIEEPDGVGRGPVILVPYNFIGERRISDKERKKRLFGTRLLIRVRFWNLVFIL